MHAFEWLTFSGHRLEYKHRVGKYKVEIKKELVRSSRSSPVEKGMWHKGSGKGAG
jgi:hypothetical protein